jgi:hypothetical protein
MNAVVQKSVLTCPHCGFAAEETMPIDACQFFYETDTLHLVTMEARQNRDPVGP